MADWTFRTRRYLVRHFEIGEKVHLACIYRRGEESFPIGSASTFLHPTLTTRNSVVRHAIERATDKLIRQAIGSRQ